jgi:hypothetical protein
MISKEKSDFLRSLADAHGRLDPTAVIEAARPPSSPIHSDFTWDVDEAAQACWVEEARRLIRLIKLEVTIEHRTVTAVAYVTDPLRPPTSRRYVDITVAARQAEMAQQVLMAELDRIAAAVRRAQEIAAVLGLTDQLNELLSNVDAVRVEAERRAEAKAAATKRKSGKGKGKKGKPIGRPPGRPSPRRRPEMRT